MSGSLRVILLTGCILAIGLAALAQAPKSQQAQSEEATRFDALKKLAASVLAAKIDEKHTVRAFIKGTDLPGDDLRPLLRGVMQFPPIRYYGDGTCAVRVAIAPEQVCANLDRIKKEHYKQQDGEFAKVKFGKLVLLKQIEAVGSATFPLWGARNPVPTTGIPGWEDVSARARCAAERAAYDEASKKLRAKAEKLPLHGKLTIKDFISRSKAAREALDEYFKAMRPESKAYLSNGIVEVKAVVKTSALTAKVAAINEKIMTAEQKVDAQVIKKLAQAQKAVRLTAMGYARPDGKPVEPKALSWPSAKLDLAPFSGISLE